MTITEGKLLMNLGQLKKILTEQEHMINTGFSQLNSNGYEASFFKLYRNSEA